jgi:hypothetical protein
MNKLIPAFNIPFYEYDCPHELTEKVFEEVKTLTFKDNIHNNLLDGFYYNLELFDWFNSCLRDLSLTLFDNDTLGLKVIQCWATLNKYSEYHKLHQHPNSLYSGILYLTSHDKKGKTIFKLPNPWYFLENSNSFEFNHKKERSITFEYPAQKGKLLVFPSNILHGSTPNVNKHFRYIVGFNSFLEGNLGSDFRLTNLRVQLQ